MRAETRLLKRQQDELYALLKQISSSIEEVFDEANAQAAQEFNRIRGDMERLDGEINKVSNGQAANALFEKLNQLSPQIPSPI